MYRTALAPDAGMLFVFDRDEDRYFWMENTLIPLDLIYISGDGRVVGVRENTVPGSRERISPPGPCTYVLEVNGGDCSRHGVCAGDLVTIGKRENGRRMVTIRSHDGPVAIKTAKTAFPGAFFSQSFNP